MIVVTGGAGFIGSNLVAALEARGETEIVVVDRLGTGDKWRNLAKRELAGIVAPEELFAWLDAHAAEVRTIFHMGAISSTVETDADLIVRSNVELTLRLWEWCAWRGAGLIYASSAATYGDREDGFDDDMAPEALARLRPLNPYGWSKHLVDRRIARLVQANGVRPPHWAGLKFFNVYGPNEAHKGGQRSVVPQLVEQIQAGGRCRLFKSYRPDVPDGGQRRDFVWVDDVVDAMLWLADHPGVSGLFNLGSGAARSFADLAQAVFAAMGRAPAIDWIEMPESLRPRYQYFTQADMARLRAAGWTGGGTSLEDGVARYVRDFLLQPDPYR